MAHILKAGAILWSGTSIAFISRPATPPDISQPRRRTNNGARDHIIFYRACYTIAFLMVVADSDQRLPSLNPTDAAGKLRRTRKIEYASCLRSPKIIGKLARRDELVGKGYDSPWVQIGGNTLAVKTRCLDCMGGSCHDFFRRVARFDGTLSGIRPRSLCRVGVKAIHCGMTQGLDRFEVLRSLGKDTAFHHLKQFENRRRR